MVGTCTQQRELKKLFPDQESCSRDVNRKAQGTIHNAKLSAWDSIAEWHSRSGFTGLFHNIHISHPAPLKGRPKNYLMLWIHPSNHHRGVFVFVPPFLFHTPTVVTTSTLAHQHRMTTSLVLEKQQKRSISTCPPRINTYNRRQDSHCHTQPSHNLQIEKPPPSPD